MHAYNCVKVLVHELELLLSLTKYNIYVRPCCKKVAMLAISHFSPISFITISSSIEVNQFWNLNHVFMNVDMMTLVFCVHNILILLAWWTKNTKCWFYLFICLSFSKRKGWYQKARPARGCFLTKNIQKHKAIDSYNSTQQSLRNNIEYISKCNRIQQTHTIKRITQHQKRT